MVNKLCMISRHLLIGSAIFCGFLLAHAQNEGDAYKELLDKNYLSQWNGTQFDFVDRRAELRDLIDSLDKEISENSNNPVLYMYRGLAHRHLMRAERLTELKQMSKYEYFSSSEYLDHVKSITNDYRKAIELDRKEDKTGSLTYDVLSVSAASTILPADVSELLIRREFEILKGEVPDGAVRFYEDSYTSMYERYIDEGDFENALRIVDEMIEEFPNQAETYKNVRNEILKRQERTKSSEGKRDPKSLSAQAITRLALDSKLSDVVEEKPESGEQTSVVKQPPAKPESQPINEPVAPYTSEESEYKRWLLILALLAIGLAVIIYIIRRPRK